MNHVFSAGRRGRASAALLAALALLISGCATLDDPADSPPAANVIDEAPIDEGPADEAASGDAGSAARADASASGAADSTANDGPFDLDSLGAADSDGGQAAGDPNSPAAGTALELLATIPVKGRAPKTGYDRKAQFGSPWTDVDRNGCDTRNDMLQRDLTNLTMSGRCKVLTGTLADKYTGKTIDFVRGNKTSTLVQIDHVVALSDAWQKGAQQLSQEARIAFANDPINLYAADGPANSAKGDGDAATWLPKNRAFRCEYVARQVSAKAAYALWVTPAEQAAMQRVLATCPDEPAVVSTLVGELAGPLVPDPDPSAAATPAPGPSTEPAPAQTQTQPRPAVPTPETYFKNCTAAREAGAAPVHSGQPGYGRHLDRDGDGVGCE